MHVNWTSYLQFIILDLQLQNNNINTNSGFKWKQEKWRKEINKTAVNGSLFAEDGEEEQKQAHFSHSIALSFHILFHSSLLQAYTHTHTHTISQRASYKVLESLDTSYLNNSVALLFYAFTVVQFQVRSSVEKGIEKDKKVIADLMC